MPSNQHHSTAECSSASSSLQELQKQSTWVWCGERVPKNQIVFFCQIFVVYCVIGAAITNLSLQEGDKQLWTILLSSCIGYILPSPSLKFTEGNRQSSNHPSSPRSSSSSSSTPTDPSHLVEPLDILPSLSSHFSAQNVAKTTEQP